MPLVPPALHAIEPLACAIRSNKLITRIHSKKLEHKIALYADDIVLYVTNLKKSLPTVLKVFQDFSKLSGLKVNFSQSEINQIYLLQEKRNNLEWSLPFKRTKTTWRYLSIHFPRDLGKKKECNYDSVVQAVTSQLKLWNKLTLSWPEHLQLIKSFVLPKFLLFFHIIPIEISGKGLQRWQKICNKFIWCYISPRINFNRWSRPCEKDSLNYRPV